jgi:hypothetical protein
MTVITIKFILNWYVFAYVYLYRIINFRKTTKLSVCFCFYIILLTFKNSEGAVVAVPIYHCAYVCLNTGPRWPGGTHLPAKKYFTMDFCLCGAILNLKAFCFGAIPDILIELIAYWSVPQSRQSWQLLSGIETKLVGASGYWQKKSWRWIHADVVQF